MAGRGRARRCFLLHQELLHLRGENRQVSRRRARYIARKLSVLRRRCRQAKLSRTRAIVQVLRHRVREARNFRRGMHIAVWNTRGLGAVAGNIDQELKMEAILERMRIQRWDIVGLTDLKYREDGVRRFRHKGLDYFLVIAGRVGFLMNRSWYQWWQDGGAILYQRSVRVAALQFPREGWRRGLMLSCVYGPTSAAGKRARQAVRQDLDALRGMLAPTSLHIIVGDLNAELGNNRDHTRAGWQVVGSFPSPRVSVSGAEWREWCLRHGFRDCGSRYQMRHRWTWFHPRYRSLHELDHILIPQADL